MEEIPQEICLFWKPSTQRAAYQVINAVCRFYHMTLEELANKGHSQNLTTKRQMLSYLLHEDAKCSFPSIGALLGQDHSTVLSNCARMKKFLPHKIELKETVTQIQRRYPRMSPCVLSSLKPAPLTIWTKYPGRVALVKIVSEVFGIPGKMLLSKNKEKPVHHARLVVIYLLRSRLNMSTPEVGRFLELDRTAVRRGFKRIRAEIESNT